MVMAVGNPVAQCQPDYTVELVADIDLVGILIQKHLAFDYLHASAYRGTSSLAIANSQTVEEIELVVFECLHDLLYTWQS